MKHAHKLGFILVWIIISIFIGGCEGEGENHYYNISGDNVYWENEYGYMNVYPHTCTDFECCQFANITSYLPTQDLDIAFRFLNPINNGEIYRWINHTHEIDNWTEVCEIQFINGTNQEICWPENNPYEITNYSWQDVTSYLSHSEYNDAHFYIAENVNFIQNKEYQYKWCYEVPTQRGKWDLIAKRSSDTLQEAYSSGHYIILDPWFDTDAVRYEYNYPTVDNSEWINYDGNPGNIQANQLFTVGTTGANVNFEVRGASFQVGDYGDNLQYLNVFITDTNSTGTGCDWDSIIAKRLNYDVSATGHFNVTFSENGTLNLGEKYCLVINSSTTSAFGIKSRRAGSSYDGGYVVYKDDTIKVGFDLWFAIWGGAAELIDSVNITPTPAYYDTPLNCSVNYTYDSPVNINFTWLKDSVNNYTYDEWLTDQPSGNNLIYSPTLVNSLTAGENWTCTVYVENSTNSDLNETDLSSKVISTYPPTFDYVLNWSDYHNIDIDLDYNCSDVEGDAINYSILNITSNLNTDLTINISTGEIDYNPIQNETGYYEYNVTCTDGSNNATSQLNITILNRAPTIPLTYPANNSYFFNSYNLTCNSSTDPDGDTVYYQFWNTTDLLQNSINTTYLLSDVGDTIWNCKACDGLDNSTNWTSCSNFTDYTTTTIATFDNCTAGNVTLNFSYVDEDDDSDMTANFEANFLIETSGTSQTILFDLPVATNHLLCLEGRNNATISSAMIEYNNESYDARNYYFCNAEVSNVTQNIDLYLLETTLASGITFKVEDSSGSPLESQTIYIEKYSVAEDSYSLVAMGKTDEDGQDVIFLRGGTAATGDTWYRFKVYDENCNLLQTSVAQKIIESDVTIEIGENQWVEHQNIVGDVIHALTFNESTYTYRLDFSTTSGLQRWHCMHIQEQRPGAYVYDLDDTCLYSTSGMMTYTLPRHTHSYKGVSYTKGSAKVNTDLLYWEDITNVFGNTGVLMTVGLIILLSLIGAFSPIGAIVFGTVGLVLATMIGLLTIGQSLLTTIIVLAILIIMKLGRENL